MNTQTKRVISLIKISKEIEELNISKEEKEKVIKIIENNLSK